MEEILSKAYRLEKPRTVSVPLRRDVYETLSRIGTANGHIPVSSVVRAIVEDFYDRIPVDPDPDQEVTGNE